MVDSWQFLSDDEFAEDFADELDLEGTGGTRLSAANRRKADKHHREAANLIRGKLLACGWTEAQIQGWARGRDFERNVGLCFAYVGGSMGEGYDQEAIGRRCDYWVVPFTTPGCAAVDDLAGDRCPPDTDDAGSVGYGCVTGPSCGGRRGRTCC